MNNLTTSILELIIRAIVVYFFLLIGVRLTGKRQLGQMAPFDFVLVLLISNAVQNAMNAGDNSLTAGLILAGTLLIINFIIAKLSAKFRNIEILVEGRPKLLIHNGQIYEDILKKENISKLQLNEVLRENNAELYDVRFAILENNGHISLKLRT